MYYLRQGGQKCHGLYRNMLDYIGASDEGNINLLGLAGELSIFYCWKKSCLYKKGQELSSELTHVEMVK